MTAERGARAPNLALNAFVVIAMAIGLLYVAFDTVHKVAPADEREAWTILWIGIGVGVVVGAITAALLKLQPTPRVASDFRRRRLFLVVVLTPVGVTVAALLGDVLSSIGEVAVYAFLGSFVAASAGILVFRARRGHRHPKGKDGVDHLGASPESV